MWEGKRTGVENKETFGGSEYAGFLYCGDGFTALHIFYTIKFT